MTRLSTATKVDNVESREYRRKLEVKPNTNMHVRQKTSTENKKFAERNYVMEDDVHVAQTLLVRYLMRLKLFMMVFIEQLSINPFFLASHLW